MGKGRAFYQPWAQYQAAYAQSGNTTSSRTTNCYFPAHRCSFCTTGHRATPARLTAPLPHLQSFPGGEVQPASGMGFPLAHLTVSSQLCPLPGLVSLRAVPQTSPSAAVACFPELREALVQGKKLSVGCRAGLVNPLCLQPGLEGAPVPWQAVLVAEDDMEDAGYSLRSKLEREIILITGHSPTGSQELSLAQGASRSPSSNAVRDRLNTCHSSPLWAEGPFGLEVSH